MNILELFVKIGADTSEYDSKVSNLGKAMSSVASVATKAIATATTAITAFGGASVKAGAEFDSAMSQVSATMGYSIDELNDSTSEASKNFELLRNFAQEMGSTTAFSATESAEALNYMALAGYDAQTSMKMLPTVLNLASAGGIELATASDMVTDAQTALGLSLNDTSAMVDQMAMTASKSNTSVAQLGEAFLTIGANARNLSGGTQELSTVLGVLADNGIKGSEAGTHLRNIMLALNPTTEGAINAWEELKVKAYDAKGELRPLEEIFVDLNKAMEGKSTQEKSDLLSTMFNRTDLASINALLGTTKERYEELSASIGDATGSAQEMANVQLDNLNGDITLFKSALEGVQIAVSDMLTPAIREFVQIGGDGLQKISDSLSKGDIDGAFKAIGESITSALNKIVDMLPQATEAGVKLLESLINGIVQNLPQLVSVAKEIVLKITKFIIDNLPTIIKAGIEIIVELAKGIAEALPELIPSAIDAILQIVDALLDNIDLLVDASIAIVVGLAEGIINALPKLIEKAPTIIAKLVEAIIKNVPKLLEASTKIIISLYEGIVKNLPKMLKAGIDIIGELISGIISLKTKLFETAMDIVDTIEESIKKAISGAKQWGKDLIDNFVQGIKDNVAKVQNAVSNVGKTIKSYIGFSEPDKGPLSNFHTYAPDMMDLFTQGIQDNEQKLRNQLSKSFDFGDFSDFGSIQTNITPVDNIAVNNNNELNEVISLLKQYLPNMTKDITLNTGDLVGGIAGEMDRVLGQRQLVVARGI